MWLMLQQGEADDYILATGETHSVRDFAEQAADAVGFKLAWEGEAEDTRGIDRTTGHVMIRVNPEFYRPAKVDMLLGDPSKARAKLGWKSDVTFDQLVEMMVRADMDRIASR